MRRLSPHADSSISVCINLPSFIHGLSWPVGHHEELRYSQRGVQHDRRTIDRSSEPFFNPNLAPCHEPQQASSTEPPIIVSCFVIVFAHESIREILSHTPILKTQRNHLFNCVRFRKPSSASVPLSQVLPRPFLKLLTPIK